MNFTSEELMVIKVIVEIWKIVFLYLGIRWSFTNFILAYYERDIPRLNFILQTIGITGFVYLQWILP